MFKACQENVHGAAQDHGHVDDGLATSAGRQGGRMSPHGVLAAADHLLREVVPGARGTWPRACAWLIRLALETALDAYWQRQTRPWPSADRGGRNCCSCTSTFCRPRPAG